MAPGRQAEPVYASREFVLFNDIAPAIAGATDFAQDGISTHLSTATTASSVKQVASETGVIELATGATAHHQITMQMGSAAGAFWAIAPNRGSNFRGFEARVAIPDGSNSAAQGVFIGMAAGGNAAANFLVNTTMALKDTDLIGFHFPIGGVNVVRPVYRKAGSAVVDAFGPIFTYTPGTFFKLGLFYKPSTRGDGNVLSWFVDNAPVFGIDSATAESTLPLGVRLTPTLSVKTSGASAAKLQCDWIDAYRI